MRGACDTGNVPRTTPRIVADFDYDGYTWLVVDWPGTLPGEFRVYRSDLPFTWREAPHEDLR